MGWTGSLQLPRTREEEGLFFFYAESVPGIIDYQEKYAKQGSDGVLKEVIKGVYGVLRCRTVNIRVF